MTNEQFLLLFDTHLEVAEPKRTDIIVETKTHLDEDGEEKMGDPKKMAGQLNRVYFGRFGTFDWLIVRALLFPLADFWITDLIDPRWRHDGQYVLWYSVLTMSLVIHVAAIANAIISAHTLAHMNRRWIRAGWWALAVVASATILMAYFQFLFPSTVGTSETVKNFIWNVGTLSLESIIFVLAFFVTWPRRRTTWLEKIGLSVAILSIGLGLWYVINYLFPGLFTYLYTYPWFLRAFSTGLHGWDIAIMIAIVGVFLLHEIRFSWRMFHRKAV